MSDRDDQNQKKIVSNPMPVVPQGDDDRTVIVSPADPDATVFTGGEPPRRYPMYISNSEIPRPKPSRRTRPNIGFSHYGKGKEAQRAVLPNLPIARELPGSKTKVVTIPPKPGAPVKHSGQQPAAKNPQSVSGQSRIAAILSGGVLGGPQAGPCPAPADSTGGNADRVADLLRQSNKHKISPIALPDEQLDVDENRKTKRMCREDVLNILTQSGNLKNNAPAGSSDGTQQVAQSQPASADSKPPTSLRRLLGGSKSDDTTKKDEPAHAEDYRAVISASGSYLSMRVEGGLLTGPSFEKCQQRLVDLENGAPPRSRYRRSYGGNQDDTAGMEAVKEAASQNNEESEKQ